LTLNAWLRIDTSLLKVIPHLPMNQDLAATAGWGLFFDLYLLTTRRNELTKGHPAPANASGSGSEGGLGL